MQDFKKKGVFYTIAAIALSTVIIFTYSSYNNNPLSDNMKGIEIRIDNINFFIKDVENDLEKGAYIASYRTFVSFNQFISTNGTFIPNIEDKFAESFLNGTMQNKSLSLMSGSTFTDWASKISNQANKVDISFGYDIQKIKLVQFDPWTIEISVNITLHVHDKKNTSFWDRPEIIKTKLDIRGFEDPLYVINTIGRVSNQIQISNATPFVINGKVDNLLRHTNDSYYYATNLSPSYLMRLQGDLGNSVYGIESLVNLDKFQAQGITLDDRSVVDYIYFGTGNTVNYRVNSTPYWFKIDFEHLNIYGVTNITI